jgi:hypothetical protein
MNLEDRIAVAKELIRKREEIDQQLAELFGGAAPKKQKCSICGSTEHTARTCPQKSSATPKPQAQTPLPSPPFDALSRHVMDGDGGA